MKNYKRELPRDAFNESKLLSGLGHFVVAFEHNTNIVMWFNGKSFNILQEESSGDIYVDNFYFKIKSTGYLYNLFSGLNNKSKFTVFIKLKSDDEVRVFDEDGAVTKEFNKIITTNL